MKSVLLTTALAAGLALPLAARDERLDYDALYRIKEEGLQRSQVMEITSWLTDIHGPRLTGSPNIRAAAGWAEKTMKEWGLANVKLEPWGTFGRGWSNERFAAHVVAPQAYPLIGYPKAWSPGTNGPVIAEAVFAPIESEADFARFKGQLAGKFVLSAPVREVREVTTAPSHRYTEKDLEELSAEDDTRARQGGRQFNRAAAELARKRLQFYKDEGALAVIDAGRGDGGTVFVQGGGVRGERGSQTPRESIIPEVSLAVEHYGRIVRTLQKKIPVRLELDVKNTFHAEEPPFNVIAEIPGTDRADEVVMLGAHFDSWHSGTGATDNAAGSAVMMEAVRILKATSLKPRRTIRIALWSGEENGLLGSRAYVKNHFADPETMQLKPEHAKLSGYFNVDNGTGKIRGVYLQGNEAIAPLFRAWMEPFRNLGMTTLSIQDTGGTDHLAFDAAGLPGFQFIQDPVEYDSRTHHSNMDVYERIQEPDMKQNAVIVAAFVYQTANRDEKLPRKPLPKPQPRRDTTTASR
ncbi:MAG: M28 family metallopeptidase [Vicinamibacterales bacterium]